MVDRPTTTPLHVTQCRRCYSGVVVTQVKRQKAVVTQVKRLKAELVVALAVGPQWWIDVQQLHATSLGVVVVTAVSLLHR